MVVNVDKNSFSSAKLKVKHLTCTVFFIYMAQNYHTTQGSHETLKQDVKKQKQKTI